MGNHITALNTRFGAPDVLHGSRRYAMAFDWYFIEYSEFSSIDASFDLLDLV